MDMKYELLRLRLDATREAQKRSRLAFTAITILSLAMIIAAWNAYISWDRHFLIKHDKFSVEKDKEGVDVNSTDSVVHWAQQQHVAEFAKNEIISVPLLGIRVAISDAAILGSLGLLILCIWFALSLRRENHTIGMLLKDTTDESLELKRFVFHGICSYLVFTDIGESEFPLVTLTRSPRQDKPHLRMRNIFKMLIFLPLLAVSMIIVMDFLTMFWLDAAYRFPHAPIIGQILDDKTSLAKFVVYEIAALVMATAIGFLCNKVLAFEHGTGSMLREFAETLEPNITTDDGSIPADVLPTLGTAAPLTNPSSQG
jgi:hypothetical protein